MKFKPQELSIKKVTPRAKEIVEEAGRVCWRSEGRTPDRFIRMLIKKGHLSVLEHAHISIEATVDVAITREMVRHRLFSYSNESTRYVEYDGLQVTPIEGWVDMSPEDQKVFLRAFTEAENAYRTLIARGLPADKARKVLPLGTASKIFITGNLRAWRDMLWQRAIGTTGKPHHDIQELYLNLLIALHNREDMSIFFEDLYREAEERGLLEKFNLTV